MSFAILASAQSQTHAVTVDLPDLIGIRIVGAGMGPRSVTFDYAADPDGFIAAIDGDGSLTPTDVTRFDDIELNVSGIGLWSVFVQATPLAYEGSGSGAGMDLADIRVVRGSASGLEQDAIFLFLGIFGTYDTAWTLAASPRRIAGSWVGTRGWRSLGFNGWDYSLSVSGDEEAGTFSTTVTYFLTSP